jgi:hypothetical protein
LGDLVGDFASDFERFDCGKTIDTRLGSGSDCSEEILVFGLDGVAGWRVDLHAI